MKDRELPPQEYLRHRLSYDADTGTLTWLTRAPGLFNSQRAWRSWNTKHAGKPAFTAVTTNGYSTGRIDDRQYLAHRVIWKMVHGADPVEPDHIDGDRANNREVNLRDGTRRTNMMNAKRRSNNTSGIGNVGKRGGKWAVRFHDTQYGSFDDLNQAIIARNQAAQRLGFSARHGK